MHFVMCITLRFLSDLRLGRLFFMCYSAALLAAPRSLAGVTLVEGSLHFERFGRVISPSKLSKDAQFLFSCLLVPGFDLVISQIYRRII